MGSKSSTSCSTSTNVVHVDNAAEIEKLRKQLRDIQEGDVKDVEKLKEEKMKLQQLIEQREDMAKHLEGLKAEVIGVAPDITESVKSTFVEENDALVVKYKDLNKYDIRKSIDLLFPTFPDKEFIVATASSMMQAIGSVSSMQEAMRWHDRKAMKRIGNRVFGLETHYKILVLRTNQGSKYNPWHRPSSEETLLIAYKVFAHMMDLDVDNYPDDETMRMLAPPA